MSIDPWVAGRISDLAAYLTTSGVLSPGTPDGACWLTALHQVPRHLFVPARAWMQPQDERSEGLIDRNAYSDSWWRAVYSNTAIITQRGDGQPSITDTSAAPTSSTSSPHVVFDFLRLLDLDHHHRVLEIGTGTGWTAAMLSWRLGDDLVTTIEVDEAVAATATENLKVAGLSPTQLVGDGALGAPDGAPYDRVHVTCGVRDIPYAWIEQTRPGGVIVLPYMPPHGGWGEQLRLDVLDDGTAVGAFRYGCRYMMMRSQRVDTWPAYQGDGVESSTRLDPRAPWAALDYGFGLALAAAAPHVTITTAGWEGQDGHAAAWVMRLRDLQGDGWAIIIMRPGEDTHVIQSGGRQLWNALEGAFMEWLGAGRPGRDQYRMIVTPAGQDIWLP
ncbi:protein-L-isoaspartate(D-aspartate) O-methyltransferase [Nonomuraea sp. NBC_00507]|uniref:protein-L-isoaspartate(D-aspartate) O-methyltransferase n=1 Tax=Nonomuraea sp. NBC_00507 TaxID=2976002 RepID=UPI002E16E2FF